ncbi:MAG: hypothetical protein ISS71_08725 [Phycisphaerae bacterium]|nr:hypothetical protein [Phycisphaerae bacterium]
MKRTNRVRSFRPAARCLPMDSTRPGWMMMARRGRGINQSTCSKIVSL